MRGEARLLRRLQALGAGCPPLDRALRLAARYGPVAQIALWCSLPLGGGGLRARLLAWLRAGLALGLATLCVWTLRALVGRPRPFTVGDAAALLAREPGPSFPSRHTASAVAMALGVQAVAPRRGALMVALATWMGLGRLYCGLHYPSDVLVGAAVGALAVRAVERATRRSHPC